MDDLLPDESVLGVDVEESVVYGAENARLGAAVSTDGESVAAIAPGSTEVWRDGELSEATVFATGFTVDRGAWEAGEATLRFLATGEEFDLLPSEKIVVSNPEDEAGLVWAAGASGLREVTKYLESDGSTGIDAVAIGTRPQPLSWEGDVASSGSRAVRTCAGEVCTVTVANWSPDEFISYDAGLSAQKGAGLALWNDAICSGNPQLDDDDGAGFVECTDGTRIDGLPGDHLGLAIAGGYAIGQFNKWIVPARTRVVPLGGGEVFALERGAEAQPTALAAVGDLLVIGQPYEMHGGMNTGALHVVTP